MVHHPPRKYIILLAAAAALILVIGGRFRPRQAIEAAPSPAEMLRLQSATQRRTLENLSSYFAGVADEISGGLVWLDGLDQSGIVWDGSGLVVTGPPAGPVPPRVEVLGRRLEPKIVSSHFPVAAFQMPPGTAATPVFRRSAGNLARGSWTVLAAARRSGGITSVPGTFGGLEPGPCGEFQVSTMQTNLPLGPGSEGNGIFDIDRNLVALVVRCGDRYTALEAGEVDRILREADTVPGQLLRRYGLRLEPLDDAVKRYFGVERGLLVTEVFAGRPAALGLEPGDIVQGLDDGEVNTHDDLARLVLPMAYPAFDLWVWRDRKTIRVGMPATEKEFAFSVPESNPGILLEAPGEGFLIEEIVPGSAAAAAALRPGDRLLRVGVRRPRNVKEAEAALARRPEGPIHLVVERGSKRFGVLLPR